MKLNRVYSITYPWWALQYAMLSSSNIPQSTDVMDLEWDYCLIKHWRDKRSYWEKPHKGTILNKQSSGGTIEI